LKESILLSIYALGRTADLPRLMPTMFILKAHNPGESAHPGVALRSIRNGSNV